MYLLRSCFQTLSLFPFFFFSFFFFSFFGFSLFFLPLLTWHLAWTALPLLPGFPEASIVGPTMRSYVPFWYLRTLVENLGQGTQHGRGAQKMHQCAVSA